MLESYIEGERSRWGVYEICCRERLHRIFVDGEWYFYTASKNHLAVLGVFFITFRSNGVGSVKIQEVAMRSSEE